MNCEGFKKLLDNYEDLTAEQKLAMAEHTSVCEECRNEFDFFMSVIQAVKNLPEMEAPPDFVERVNKQIDSESRASRFIRRFRGEWSKYSSIAACLVVAVVVGANSSALMAKMEPADNGIVITEKFSVSKSEPEEVYGSDVKENVKAETGDKEKEDEEAARRAARKQETNKSAGISLPTLQPLSTPGAVSVSRYIPRSKDSTSGTSSSAAVSRPSASAVTSAPSAASESGENKPAPASQTPQINAAEEKPAETAPNHASSEEIEIRQEEKIPDSTDTAQNDNIDNTAYARGTDESEPAVGEEDSYKLKRNKYRIASAYSKSYDTPAEESNSDISGYSISEEDLQIALSAANGGETENTPIKKCGSIYVAIQDSDEFMSIMNSYVSASVDNYYIMTSSSLSAMLAELAAEGISYGDFIDPDATGQIAFSVVFF